MRKRLLTHYTENVLSIGSHKISTYIFGEGKHTVFLFPPFPHSGLLYTMFYGLCPDANVRYITMDLPGWIGASQGGYRGAFSYNQLLEIVCEVIRYYDVKKFSIVGYSFGSSIVVQLPEIFKDRIDKAVFISPIVNSALLHDYPQMQVINYLRHKHYYSASGYYVKMRFKKYTKSLIEEGFPMELLQRYQELLFNINLRTVLDSINQLFTNDFSHELKYFKHIPTMIVNSINESHVFIEQADYLRSKLEGEENIFVYGAHENFLLFPSREQVQHLLNFLTK